MIIVPVKEGENIERAIKKFKRKFDKTGEDGACEVCAVVARSRRYVIVLITHGSDSSELGKRGNEVASAALFLFN